MEEQIVSYSQLTEYYVVMIHIPMNFINSESN